MGQDATLRVNWFNVNVPTIIAIAGTGWAIATYVNGLDYRLSAVEEYRVQRSAVTDRNFAELNAKLAPALDSINNLAYRMGQAEANDVNIGKRVDRISESLLGAMEAVRKDVNTLTTEVRVLGSKLDEDRKRAGFAPLPLPQFR